MTTLQIGPASTADRLRKRGRQLAYATVAYNVVEATVGLAAGGAAGSAALIGFGLDAIVEVSSALVVIWQFSHRMSAQRERKALRAIGISFYALAGWIILQSVFTLLLGGHAEPSPVGIGLAALSLMIMPLLARAKRRLAKSTADSVGSATVAADAKQTQLCVYLSMILLVGLGVNVLWGWWWADSLAAVGIAVIAWREGRAAWRGDDCCHSC